MISKSVRDTSPFHLVRFSVPLYGTRVAAFVSLSALLHVIKILEERSRRNIHAAHSLSFPGVSHFWVCVRVCESAEVTKKEQYNWRNVRSNNRYSENDNSY